MTRVIVIGAGIGGLTTAAVLARAGLDVTVLESQVYPGGCTGTFFHQGYRFDSGATLAAGFYPGGPMDLVSQAAGITSWPIQKSNMAIVVHLPDGTQINRWTDDSQRGEDHKELGPHSSAFYKWQNQTANSLWKLALKLPPWPPQSIADFARISEIGIPWLLSDHNFLVLRDSFRKVSSHLQNASDNLRLFVDAQLLISAQVTSEYANAFYGAAALDLPRRGVVHLMGGMGAIAETLVDSIRSNGGQVFYRQEVTHISTITKNRMLVESKQGGSFEADVVIGNLSPWNAAALVDKELKGKFSRIQSELSDGWGAFMVYVGLKDCNLQPDFPLHHQIIVRRPFGEGNSVFASLSPSWDPGRAPVGHRALTISTHTKLSEWWNLYEHDRVAYEARKEELAVKTLSAAEIALPGLRESANMIMSGTPVTFQRYTLRERGWVGGFPQTSLFRAIGPRIASNFWLVGDSIFPGQSTAAVSLGGLRVADMVLKKIGIRQKYTPSV